LYWPGISSPYVSEIVETADICILVGPNFNDFSTTGWTSLLLKEHMIEIHRDYAIVCGKRYSFVDIVSLLTELIASSPQKSESIVQYRRHKSFPHIKTATVELFVEDDPLTLEYIQESLQALINSNSSIIVETGDCWFLGQKLQLDIGAKYHVQLQYGSIGWSVGAALGAAIASGITRKVIVLIGDGSLQECVQSVSYNYHDIISKCYISCRFLQ
jgi:pyruvate decarboxylase